MIFLDTSFLVALEIESDSNHEKAVALGNDITNDKFGEMIISDYIFDEAVTATLWRTKSLEKASVTGTTLRESCEILKVDETDIERAWELFKSQKGTKFSFTDCTNIVVMTKYKITHIATFDEDFTKVKEIKVVQ